MNTPHLYYMSDTAFEQLRKRAVDQGYIKEFSSTSKGFSNFLNDLSKIDGAFLDTRPNQVKERHAEEVRAGYAPLWKSYWVRRPRLLRITEDAQQAYMKIAHDLKIIGEYPYNSLPGWRTGPALGYVFEALGLGWITPTTWPIKEKVIK